MSLLVIILSLILLSGFYGLDTDESTGIDVLSTLKSKNSSCDLQNFVKSTEAYSSEYKALVDDLTKYCSNSESTKQYRIICRMILIELEIGCSLFNKSHPSAIKYTISYTSTQVCSIDRISYTNSWIWTKLTANEKNQIGVTSIQLCPKITSLTETLRLVRFFYKIAPRIRRADTTSDDPVGYKVPPGIVGANNTILNKTNQSSQLLINKTIDNSPLVKKNVGEIIPNKTQAELGPKKDDNPPKEQVIGDPGIENPNNQREKRKESDDEHLLGNKAEHLEYKNDDDDDDDDNEPNIIDSADVKRKQAEQKDSKKGEVDSKKVDAIEIKPANEAKKNEEGLPLGRAGERPEREQVNERPKPKALDANSVYKANGREERNWVEGKGIEHHPENLLNGNSNHHRPIRLEENPSIVGEAPRKKPSLKSRSSRFDYNEDGWTGNFITSFLIFTLAIIIFYLVLHNKNKVLGLLIEGCRRNRAIYNRRLGTGSGVTRHLRLSQSE